VTSAVVLDTGILGMVVHPRRGAAFNAWWEGILASEAAVFIPEIADYELRRELLLNGFVESIRHLDELETTLEYLPLTTETMRRAAELWAYARRKGRPFADPKMLDADVILAAQAQQVNAIVVTDNVGHLGLFVESKPWEEVTMP